MEQETSESPRFLIAAVVTTVVLALAAVVWEALRRSRQVDSSVDASKAAEERPQGTEGKGKAQKKQAPSKVHHHPTPQSHHHLCINTLKGHVDVVTGLAFASNGRGLATACADRSVRVFKLEDVVAKSFKFLKLNVPPGQTPTAVAFGDGPNQLVVAGQGPEGAHLCLYASASGKSAAEAKEAGKLAPPEIKWEKDKVHGYQGILTLHGAVATHNERRTGLVASCSEGTEIKVWSAAHGKLVGQVDTNQLKNHMAAISPDGRFLAAAAFTADVKVWELQAGKDGAVRDIAKVMQLKGHKSAVLWLCFTEDSNRIITSSKDGTLKVWNIQVRYYMDEDPKCVFTFPCALPPLAKNVPAHYDKIAVAPGGVLLAAATGKTLHWLSTTSGKLLDSAEAAHDSEITALAWAPVQLPSGDGPVSLLATASGDRKVKLWRGPDSTES